ncbi:9104_t:CDS:2, partial [Racocetra fulgida]
MSSASGSSTGTPPTATMTTFKETKFPDLSKVDIAKDIMKGVKFNRRNWTTYFNTLMDNVTSYIPEPLLTLGFFNGTQNYGYTCDDDMARIGRNPDDVTNHDKFEGITSSHTWESIKGQIKNKRGFDKTLNVNYNLTNPKPGQGTFQVGWTDANPQNPSNQCSWILFMHNKYISAEAQAEAQKKFKALVFRPQYLSNLKLQLFKASYYKMREEAAINQSFEGGAWTDLKEKLPTGRYQGEDYFFQLQFTGAPTSFETAFEALERIYSAYYNSNVGKYFQSKYGKPGSKEAFFSAKRNLAVIDLE